MTLRRLASVAFMTIASFGLASAAVAEDHALTVEVANARSNDGVIVLCVWSAGLTEDFPRCPSTGAFRAGTTALTDGGALAVFYGLPSGRYAVTALHDENGDGRMNRAMMRPKEGLALSETEEISMPPPDFSEAAFELTQDRKIILTMQYW